MSEIKSFKLTKAVPGDVIFLLHPVSNPAISRTIHLTARTPSQILPTDWALGVFLDNGIYEMYKKGIFTFNDNESLVKTAYEEGVYFDEALDFIPSKENDSNDILAILKKGNRSEIVSARDRYGSDKVKEIAIAHVNELTTAVVAMLENMYHIQLIADGNN